jgi:hypothetical protein
MTIMSLMLNLLRLFAMIFFHARYPPYDPKIGLGLIKLINSLIQNEKKCISLTS